MTLFRALVLAVLLHGAFFYVFRSPIRKKSASPPPVIVETVGPRRGGGVAGGRGKGPGSGKRIRMSDLLVGETESPSSKTGGGARKGSGLGQGRYDLLPFEERVPLLPLFEAIWARLDAAIDYPKELVESRVEGSVAMRFTVDAKGALASDITLVHSDAVVLEAYVLSIVAASLEAGFAGPRRAERERTPVQLVVDFRTATELRTQDRNRGGIEGNMLTVRRSSYVPPVFEEAIDRFFTKYVPPVFPIPGGFYVDVVRLVQFLDNLSAPDPDAMRQVRLEGFRRRFLRANRPSGN